MKKKDLAELKSKTVKDLLKKEKDERTELRKITAKSAKEKNLKKVKMIKKNIAQILTIIREKKLNEKETK